MWEIFLATVISLSVGVREPRNVSTAPFDYELSYKLENNYKNDTSRKTIQSTQK